MPEQVRDRAVAVFARLAAAEARVHGIATEDVDFHEVGALDSIADVVGVCAALHDLRRRHASAPARWPSAPGRVAMAHGEMRAYRCRRWSSCPRGWRVRAGGRGRAGHADRDGVGRRAERTLRGPAPSRCRRPGTGAGARDRPGRANVTRVLIGSPVATGAAGDADASRRSCWRPTSTTSTRGCGPACWIALIAAGRFGRLVAADPDEEGPARPQLLSVLVAPAQVAAIRDLVSSRPPPSASDSTRSASTPCPGVGSTSRSRATTSRSRSRTGTGRSSARPPSSTGRRRRGAARLVGVGHARRGQPRRRGTGTAVGATGATGGTAQHCERALRPAGVQGASTTSR